MLDLPILYRVSDLYIRWMNVGIVPNASGRVWRGEASTLLVGYIWASTFNNRNSFSLFLSFILTMRLSRIFLVKGVKIVLPYDNLIVMLIALFHDANRHKGGLYSYKAFVVHTAGQSWVFVSP